jgi:hypothetical protein
MAFTDDTYNSPGLSEAAGFSFWIKELLRCWDTPITILSFACLPSHQLYNFDTSTKTKLT